MAAETKQQFLEELHADLTRKYRTHASTVERIWRSFDQNQRARCMKAGAADGAVLRHSRDPSLGSVCKIIPDWNLRDITDPNSDLLLEMLKHRATTSLVEQYKNGPNGGPGDHGVIMEMMLTRNLRRVEAFPNCYTVFHSDERYGDSLRILKDHAEVLVGLSPIINAGLCVPQSAGELILDRQVTLIQVLNIIIEDILELGSETRARKTTSAGLPDKELAQLSIQPRPTPLALPDLVASAADRKASLDEYL
jgi:hypothetical protein